MAKRELTFETAFATYTVKRQLGQGGSGRVFEVSDEDGQSFALKQLAGEVITSEKLKRFRNELNFCMRIEHPRILKVIDIGFTRAGEKDRSPFYVMDQYSHTLRAHMNSDLRPDTAIEVFAQILDAVEAAHLRGVWHRDLKPENILCKDNPQDLVLADFGIAHFSADLLATQVQTREGSKLANFAYAAPEQRQRGAAIDHRADIFSLGLILNEMFTRDLALGKGHRTIAEVSPKYAYLDNLVDLMLQQDPTKRPASASAVKSSLMGLQDAPKVAFYAASTTSGQSSANRAANERQEQSAVAAVIEPETMQPQTDKPLTGRDVAILEVLMGEDGAPPHRLQVEMEKLGFSRAATNIGVERLRRFGYVMYKEIHQGVGEDEHAEQWLVLTRDGTNWLVENESNIQTQSKLPGPARNSGVATTDGASSRPELEFVIRKIENDRLVVLLANRGGTSAKNPYVIFGLPGNITQRGYELDGNTPLRSWVAVYEYKGQEGKYMSYRDSSTLVIHPHSEVPLLQLEHPRVERTGPLGGEVRWNFEYHVYAEGMPPVEGVYSVEFKT